MRLQLFASLLLVAASGCLVGGRVGYHAAVVAPPPPVVTVQANVAAPAPVYQEEVYVQPDLVEVEPGIQVIADYDEPIFYSDGLYWRSQGGVWYSSRVHTGGWVSASAPARFGRIQSRSYVHYRPSGWQPRNHRAEVREGPREPVRDHREGYRQPEPVRQPEPAVRDHREGRPAPAPAPAPVVRDHRPEPQPAPAPVVRDHREAAPPPPPARKDPHTRDHR